MDAEILDSARTSAAKRLRANLLIIKRAARRLEFLRDYGLTGKYDRALRKRGGKSIPYCPSPQWEQLREKVFALYGRTCMRCGSTFRPTVDHIKPKSYYPELEFCFDNLQVLCWACNKSKSNKHETDYRMAAPAVNGD